MSALPLNVAWSVVTPVTAPVTAPGAGFVVNVPPTPVVVTPVAVSVATTRTW